MEEIELRQKNIKELRVLAKDLGVKSPTTLSKDELIQAILGTSQYRILKERIR